MKRKNIERVLCELEQRRAEAEKAIFTAAAGYDEGYYVGEESALADAISLLTKAIQG